jgi:hypothetical protein
MRGMGARASRPRKAANAQRVNKWAGTLFKKETFGVISGFPRAGTPALPAKQGGAA